MLDLQALRAVLLASVLERPSPATLRLHLYQPFIFRVAMPKAGRQATGHSVARTFHRVGMHLCIGEITLQYANTAVLPQLV